MIVGLHEGPRRQELISRPTFNRQSAADHEQIADYSRHHHGSCRPHAAAVHEERLILVERRFVIVLD